MEQVFICQNLLVGLQGSGSLTFNNPQLKEENDQTRTTAGSSMFFKPHTAQQPRAWSLELPHPFSGRGSAGPACQLCWSLSHSHCVTSASTSSCPTPALLPPIWRP